MGLTRDQNPFIDGACWQYNYSRVMGKGVQCTEHKLLQRKLADIWVVYGEKQDRGAL